MRRRGLPSAKIINGLGNSIYLDLTTMVVRSRYPSVGLESAGLVDGAFESFR